MSLVRTRYGGTSMDLVDSIPITDYNIESIKLEMGVLYDTVKFNITDVNLTEWDSNRNPLITKLGRKKKINVTISGYINEKFDIKNPDFKPFNHDMPKWEYIDIKGKNLNITFNSVRIIRDKVWNERYNMIITPPKLMIDNTHELYGFLKPIYVNKGEMSQLSEKNIYISFQELVELLKDSTVNLGVTDAGDTNITTYNWITEYKKGDTNGDKTH